ncbi:hypothetical protein [Pseudoponticoccus marisrubri]|uniref:Uncharacterized protein n=1 Tax=Pseudoponticoccus marisrubri TaxID=1685382 RepID=A0A0W7WFW8_9RHOB|nr:hypothetical protein [Pseudoponticoccus marisrubri]KUF09516.1 hypothetical protein AVJ23_16650 [Pseudoponticoccus marisrubri]
MQPAQARDWVHDCPATAEETATFVFHPRLMGVDSDEGDGDVIGNDFEHVLQLHVQVTDYDPKKPGWTGPVRCKTVVTIPHDWDFSISRGGYWETGFAEIVYIRNVPRYTKMDITLYITESDSGSDDWADLDPAPDTSIGMEFEVFVNAQQARSRIGKREGHYDIRMNHAKRLVGDGRTTWPGDKFGAYLEFVMNLHPDDKGMKTGTVTPIPTVPLPLPDQQKVVCDTYAKHATALAQEAAARGCGFVGPRWLTEYTAHFGWCMTGPDMAVMNAEQKAREAELAACIGKP